MTARDLPTDAPGMPGAPSEEEYALTFNTNQPVIEGVREITQDPNFDAELDEEPS